MKARDRATAAVDTARPYVERLAGDEELHDHVKRAYDSARRIYDELLGDRGTTGVAMRVARDKDLQNELKRTIEELRRPGEHDCRPGKSLGEELRHGEDLLEAFVVETAGRRDVLRLEQHGGRRRRLPRRRLPPPDVEREVAQALPREQVGVRVDYAVVAHPEEPERVDLEVEVRRRPERVTSRADEADDVAGPDRRSLDRLRRVGGQVRVIELVALRVAEPQAGAP